MLAGGSHIDHADRLRAGASGRVLGFGVMAPSTLGTFLRSFTRRHVRHLDKALGEALGRAWEAGAGPAEAPLTVDVDSTICEVSGKTKQGAAYGYSGRLGYHPLLAVRADTGEVLGARLRGGSSQKGNTHFVAEAVRRARRAGACGSVAVRADAGFWSYNLIEVLDRLKVQWSITVPLHANVRAAVEAIPEGDWAPIDYPEGGEAQAAETTITSSPRGNSRRVRIVVRRTRLTGGQAQLWPDWRYHPFATNTAQPPAEADLYHRRHAKVELAVRDLKEASGLAHLPSAKFAANAAWLSCAVLAHNLYRWINHLSRPSQTTRRLTAGRTIRNRLFGLPGRIVNHSGRNILRLPARWL